MAMTRDEMLRARKIDIALDIEKETHDGGHFTQQELRHRAIKLAQEHTKEALIWINTPHYSQR